jgi:purine-nucleoside phosphorylase
VFGKISNLNVVCMQGRFHPYEGYSVALCTLPIKIFKLMGVRLLVLTNAAGGLNHSYKRGDLMVIKDHMSLPVLTLQHPLSGPNDERFGPRFTPVNNIYAKKLRDVVLECGRDLNVELREGVYAVVGGPSYETVTDSKFLLGIGADAVGMSTAHEAIVAAHCGIKVVGFSIITDMVSLTYDEELYSEHDEIVKVAKARARDAEKIVVLFLKKINETKSLLE